MVFSSKFFAKIFGTPQIPKTVQLSMAKIQPNLELTFSWAVKALNSNVECDNALAVRFYRSTKGVLQKFHSLLGSVVALSVDKLKLSSPSPSITSLKSAKAWPTAPRKLSRSRERTLGTRSVDAFVDPSCDQVRGKKNVIFTCYCRFYLFLFQVLRECTLVKCHCGILIELASSTIGQRAKRVLYHGRKCM